MPFHSKLKMQHVFPFFVFLFTAAHALAAPPLEKVWSVVKPNQSYADFNPAPASQAMNGYVQKFPDGFKMLSGDKMRTGDFPGIQAGPAAAWGGYKEYPIKILFKTPAPPPGGYVLTVGLAGVSPSGKAALAADLNGTAVIQNLAPGANDDVLNFPEGFADPQVFRLFFPANTAAADGKNTLSLTLTQGAWIVYDYMRLDAVTDASATFALSLDAGTLPFLARGANGPSHHITATFFLVGDPGASLTLSASVNGDVFKQTMAPSAGANSTDLLIPEQAQHAEAQIRLLADGRVLSETTLAIEPVRHFSITLVPHSHLDIGYPDQQPNIMIGQKMYLERALDLIESDTETPMFWTSETAWPVERLLKGIGPFEEYGAHLDAPEAALMQTVTPEFLKDTMRMSNAAMAGTVASSASLEGDLNNRRAVDGSPQGWHSSGPAAGAWIQIDLPDAKELKYAALRGGREAPNQIKKIKLTYRLASGETIVQEHGPMGRFRERLLLTPPAGPVKSVRIDILDAADPAAPTSLMDVELWTPQDPAALRRRLIKAVQEGRMEISAMHLNYLTGLMPTEWLIRSFARSQFVADQTGVPLTAALMTDVPGYSWAVPDILSGMGVKYFYPALNPDRAFNCLEGMPNAFYWTGPAGGRVLTFRAFNTYNEGWWLGFGQGVDLVEKRLPSFLAPLTPDAYPYDMLILRMLGDITDDGPVPERLPAVVAAWNKKWAWPELTIGIPTPFFTKFETQYSGIIPSINGDWTGYWEDGAASSAHETIMVRRLHQALAAFTAHAALMKQMHGAQDTETTDLIENASEGIYLYDEHTWGADTSIREPDSIRTLGQWRFKRRPLAQAYENTMRAADGVIPHAADHHVMPHSGHHATMHKDLYTIAIDETTGRITSIFDKVNNRELVDSAQGFGMNELIYVESVNNETPARLQNVRVEKTADTPEYLEYAITGSAPNMPVVEQAVRLYRDRNLILFANRIEKQAVRAKEAIYFAFPFNAPGGVLRADVTGGVMQLENDQAPGASRDWISMQDTAAAVSHDYSILFYTPDAPLIAPEGLRVNTFQKKLPLQNTTLFSYIMNNYWHTNYVAEQGGEFLFRYAVAGAPRRVKDSEIVNFATAPDNPLASYRLPVSQTGMDQNALVQITPDTVRVLGVKTAEKGSGLIVRMQEMDGAQTRVTIKLAPELNITKATVTDLVEKPVRESTVAPGNQGAATVTETLGPRGYLTLLLE